MEPRQLYAEVLTDYMCTDFMEEDGDILAFVSVDGAENQDDEEMTVIAQVILSKSGDILVAWMDNGARLAENVKEAIEDGKAQLRKYWAEHRS